MVVTSVVLTNIKTTGCRKVTIDAHVVAEGAKKSRQILVRIQMQEVGARSCGVSREAGHGQVYVDGVEERDHAFAALENDVRDKEGVLAVVLRAPYRGAIGGDHE